MIKETGIDPSRTIFIDGKFENVFAARSFGMHGIVFNDQAEVIRQLKNLCGDPISRGNDFLTPRKKRLLSISESNIEFSDVNISFSLTFIMKPSLSPRFIANSLYTRLQVTSKYSALIPFLHG